MNTHGTHDVLIVDDSPAMRRFIQRTLTLSGFPVGELMEAADGLEAIDILSRRQVDLILTDINMPRMDGEEFLGRLVKDPRVSDAPVVVISTDATQLRSRRMLALGASGYVCKPFSPETLRRELERVLHLETAIC